MTLSLHLKRVALFRIFQCLEVGVSKQRVFFKVELSVECEQIAFGGQDKRINFHQRGIAGLVKREQFLEYSSAKVQAFS